jgi:hypothetical protein
MRSHFSDLPVEVQQQITAYHTPLSTSRLINKNLLNVNQPQFCNKAKTIQLADIKNFMLDPQHALVLFVNDMKAIFFNNEGYSTHKLQIKSIRSRDNIIGTKSYTFTEIIPLSANEYISIIDNYTKVDLNTTYTILQSRHCDDVIIDYSKNQLIKLLSFKQLALYNEIDITMSMGLNTWLMSNCIMFDIPYDNIFDVYEEVYENDRDAIKLLRQYNRSMFNSLNTFVKNLH